MLAIWLSLFNLFKGIIMTKDNLQSRVQALAKEVAESLENHQRIRVALDNATSAHNSLVGRFNEATELLAKFDEGAPVAQ